MSNRDWNEALEAAAKLLGDGFTFVRRPIGNDMSQKVEVYPGEADVQGAVDEATHVAGNDYGAAAVLSLRKPPTRERVPARRAGGLVRALSMTPEQRSEAGRRGAEARWGKPRATDQAKP